MKNDDRNKLAADIFYSALKSVDPYDSIILYADRIREAYNNGGFTRLHAIGFGKAAFPMAKAIENSFPDLIDAGIMITKYGHGIVRKGERTEVIEASKAYIKNSGHAGLRCFRLFEAAHPVPDENGVKGTDEIINLLKEGDEKTLVICLISGGGSALLVCPCKGVTLKEKQRITDLLLKAGADINELNTVRKHISNVKGGRLAEIAYPAKVISLILSDVIGDKLDVIASGPTSPDKTTYGDALKVLEKYGLTGETPKSILETIRGGIEGSIPETPKEGNTVFECVENIIIGSNIIALNAAKVRAEELGFHTEIVSSELTGEAGEAARYLAGKARTIKAPGAPGSKKPVCLISGGETTVTVKGKGLGGRNMELALVFAMENAGIEGLTLLSAGTDGTDGPTDAAGAIVDGGTIMKAERLGLYPEEYLKNNDSYNFFKKTNELLITGPTGTNVMDIQIMIVE